MPGAHGLIRKIHAANIIRPKPKQTQISYMQKGPFPFNPEKLLSCQSNLNILNRQRTQTPDQSHYFWSFFFFSLFAAEQNNKRLQWKFISKTPTYDFSSGLFPYMSSYIICHFVFRQDKNIYFFQSDLNITDLKSIHCPSFYTDMKENCSLFFFLKIKTVIKSGHVQHMCDSPRRLPLRGMTMREPRPPPMTLWGRRIGGFLKEPVYWWRKEWTLCADGGRPFLTMGSAGENKHFLKVLWRFMKSQNMAPQNWKW